MKDFSQRAYSGSNDANIDPLGHVPNGTQSEPLAVSVRECSRLTSLGLTSVWAAIRDQELPVVRRRGRTLVLMAGIYAFLGLSHDDQANGRAL